ncbi:MAG: hypothetical protein AB7O49_06940 [Sphingomonadales bacterium]
MARKIMLAATGYGGRASRGSENPLAVDQHVEIQWKLRMAVEQWTGDIRTAPPTYDIMDISRSYTEQGTGPKPWRSDDARSGYELVHGRLVDQDDIAWLVKAIESQTEKVVVSRIHELHITLPDGQPGFKIEVLTGQDGLDLLNADKRREQVAYSRHVLKEYWWQIGLGALVFLWWIF